MTGFAEIPTISCNPMRVDGLFPKPWLFNASDGCQHGSAANPDSFR